MKLLAGAAVTAALVVGLIATASAPRESANRRAER